MEEHAKPADFAKKAAFEHRADELSQKILNEGHTERSGSGTYDKFYPTQGLEKDFFVFCKRITFLYAFIAGT